MCFARATSCRSRPTGRARIRASPPRSHPWDGTPSRCTRSIRPARARRGCCPSCSPRAWCSRKSRSCRPPSARPPPSRNADPGDPMKKAFALAAAAFSTAALANAPAGQPAPAFKVTDLSGKVVNLADYKGKTVVLEWHNFGCPFVQKHYRSGNMQALQKKYGSGVVWLAGNSPNRTASDYMEPAKINAQMRQFGAAEAGYLMDEPGTMGAAYGAKTTPHMYIIDPSGKVVYNGAIDDKRSTNVEDVKVAKNYVATALDEMKSGKSISTATTVPYGCTVKYQ